MQSTSTGIVIAQLTAAGTPTILLVRTSEGWGLPVGSAGEEPASLVTRVQTELLAPCNSVRICEGHRKEFPEAGETAFEIAVSDSDQLRPFIESEEWHDARFCSLEEAFHIILAKQDAALRWCERAVKKVLNH